MLTHLQIRDFAIIDLIELEVRAGLTVLTGETGAGKSIVVDALALLAGGKGGAEVVAPAPSAPSCRPPSISVKARRSCASCSPNNRSMWKMTSPCAGSSPTTGARAAISTAFPCRSTCCATSAQWSSTFTASMNSSRSPATPRSASCWMTSVENLELAGSVREAHKIWIALVNRTIELEGKARDRESRIELLRHQAGELKALSLQEGEVARLAEERTRHSNRGRLAEAAQAAVGLLYDSDEGNAHATASRALAGIKTLSSVDPRLAKVVPMVDEATIQIREAARELSRYLETLDIDPARQEEVERRLAAIEELSRKHRVSAAELIGRATQLEGELAELESADNNLTALKKQQAEALDAYRKLATQLSAGRQTSARALSKDITARMQTLGMAGGRFLIDITQTNSEPAAHGFDSVEFRVTANPGQPLRPLAKVASGGRAGAAVTGGAGGLLRQGRPLHGVRRSRLGSRWRGSGNSRARAQGAGILRPGSVRHASAAGSEPGSSPSAGRQAHGRQDHAHHISNSPWTNAPKNWRACSVAWK